MKFISLELERNEIHLRVRIIPLTQSKKKKKYLPQNPNPRKNIQL